MAGPNIKDVAGLGEIIGHLKEFLLRLVEMWATREERKLKNQSLRLANTREFFRIATDYKLTPEQVIYYESLVCARQDVRMSPTHPSSMIKDADHSSSPGSSRLLKLQRKSIPIPPFED